MKNIWIAVADAGHARIVEYRPHHRQQWLERDAFVWPDARRRDTELVSDGPGSSKSSGKATRRNALSAAERRSHRCAPLRAAPQRSALLTSQPSREKCKTKILRDEEVHPDLFSSLSNNIIFPRDELPSNRGVYIEYVVRGLRTVSWTVILVSLYNRSRRSAKRLGR